ncbi:1-deoxy-D-xylulose 5-phosphate reductoisomerase [Paenibacillus eucommiae]|uniref:1-deoxy-D-xylulose 5-phosphate reductoisomerase n=1 Tax=Paenibacillus eucommiae TaxID=1355755 RepID=A0ABS4IRV8_9BACL|nr:1-deoxy-D-xylulose 5-phosphate reductoisomerase [Paenibacillus eucommiae]
MSCTQMNVVIKHPLIITASGEALRDLTKLEMKGLRDCDALQHLNFRMGFD